MAIFLLVSPFKFNPSFSRTHCGMSGASKKRGRAGASTKSYDMFNVSKK